jgi:D-glycero-D-manno-heptose 1,7-bisphosphate phosphatase
MVLESGLRRAVFLDRDGVINEERYYVGRVADFHLLPGVPAALKRLQDAGFALVVVTNQAGIAKGRFTASDYAVLTAHLRAVLQSEGVTLDGVYHCPHHPEATHAEWASDCDCRKPRPGMLLRAAAELGLSLANSVMVGDKTSDTQAGRSAGVGLTILVDSGHALGDDCLQHADLRCADLAGAAALILGRPTLLPPQMT